MIALIVLIIILTLTIPLSIFTVNQQTAAVIERFGKFKRIANAGLNFKLPFIDRVAGKLSLRVQQLDVKVETKTEDNVLLFVVVSVQYLVLPEKIVDAFYKLQNAQAQITSYVFDTVRAQVPSIKLDDVFVAKDDIAQAVKKELDHVMDDFGYGIVGSLVTDIDPDHKVKDSMNEINAAQRLRVAAVEQAEADKIRVVKAAEAEAALSGAGIAKQRQAIVDGLRESVSGFQEKVSDVSSQEVMDLVMLTQYYDTLKDVGSGANSNTILIPHGSPGQDEVFNKMRDAIIIGNEASSKNQK